MIKKLAVVGATGINSLEFFSILAERKIKIEEIVALSANEEEYGKEISYGYDERLKVKALQDYDFHGTDIAIFITGSGIAEVYTKKALESNCIVIDSSSYWRNDKDVPLIVPELNSSEILKYKNKNLISLPSASALQLAMVLKPLTILADIKRVVVSTYQAVSSKGQDAMDELFEQTKKIYENDFMKPILFKKEMPFNLIPQVGEYSLNENYEEENFIIDETNKILNTNIKITSTCVQIPVFACYSQSVNIEFNEKIDIEDAKEVLSDADGILILDKPEEYIFATPRDCAGTEEVYVSRIRKDLSVENGINLWSVADNVRVGKALNLVKVIIVDSLLLPVNKKTGIFLLFNSSNNSLIPGIKSGNNSS